MLCLDRAVDVSRPSSVGPERKLPQHADLRRAVVGALFTDLLAAHKVSDAPGEDWIANEEGNNGQNKLRSLGASRAKSCCVWRRPNASVGKRVAPRARTRRGSLQRNCSEISFGAFFVTKRTPACALHRTHSAMRTPTSALQLLLLLCCRHVGVGDVLGVATRCLRFIAFTGKHMLCIIDLRFIVWHNSLIVYRHSDTS